MPLDGGEHCTQHQAMPQILFLPDGRSVDISISESILRILTSRIPHTNECRGNARCSTCRIIVLNGWSSVARAMRKNTRLRHSCISRKEFVYVPDHCPRKRGGATTHPDANDAGLTDQRKDTTTHGSVMKSGRSLFSCRYTKFNTVC